MPYGCEITVITQEGLKYYYTIVLYKLIKVIAQEGLKHVYYHKKDCLIIKLCLIN